MDSVRVKVKFRLMVNQRPDVWYKELFWSVLFHIPELQLSELLTENTKKIKSRCWQFVKIDPICETETCRQNFPKFLSENSIPDSEANTRQATRSTHRAQIFTNNGPSGLCGWIVTRTANKIYPIVHQVVPFLQKVRQNQLSLSHNSIEPSKCWEEGCYCELLEPVYGNTLSKETMTSQSLLTYVNVTKPRRSWEYHTQTSSKPA